MGRKARVGVLVDSLSCSPFLLETVTSVAADRTIELHLLLNQGLRKTRLAKAFARLREVGPGRFLSLAFFSCVAALERKVLGLFYRDVRQAFVDRELDGDVFMTVTRLTPTVGKFNVLRYSEADLDALRRLDLDLILRGGAGIYKGGILAAAKHGIISFHHGDNRWNRGGPPGFWEVYRRRPASGFMIQILSEKLDAGDVLFRGDVRTLRTYTQNQVQLYRVSNPFMAKLISDYAATGALPKPLPKAPYSHKVLKSPSFGVTCRYVLQVIARFGKLAIDKKVLGLRERWSVAFVQSDWRDANLAQSVVVKNPPGRYLADPFVVTRDGHDVIFVEDFDFKAGKGVISAVRLRPDRSSEIIPGVLEERFHLSFPYVFTYRGELYMIPESQAAASIRLYRCTRFPECWEHQLNLMENVTAVDTMVFEHGGKWWMLTNLGIGTCLDQSRLYAFSAEHPLTTCWQPHPKNPIRFSADHGRNGGLLNGDGSKLFRVRQKYGFNRYGAGSSIAHIVRLDDEGYDEDLYCTVEPRFMKGLRGTHHMHSNGKITVFDFVREQHPR